MSNKLVEKVGRFTVIQEVEEDTSCETEKIESDRKQSLFKLKRHNSQHSLHKISHFSREESEKFYQNPCIRFKIWVEDLNKFVDFDSLWKEECNSNHKNVFKEENELLENKCFKFCNKNEFLKENKCEKIDTSYYKTRILESTFIDSNDNLSSDSCFPLINKIK
jgi:hypothetical protein